MNDQDKLRAAFEAWHKDMHGYTPLFDDEDSAYIPRDVANLFEAWQAAIAQDRQQRGEPIAWINEDELPGNYPYDAMFPYSKVDFVRLFPVYGPQPTAPAIKESLTVAVPAQEVSDTDIHELLGEYGCHHTEHGQVTYDKWTLAEAGRALLAKYGSKS